MRYSETLESKMSERKSSRGRKRTLTDSARKRKKKDSTAKYNQARICLGDQYDRWMEIKKELNVKTHAEVAKVFIVRYTNRQEDGSSIPKKRLAEIDPDSIHMQKLTSTPGPGSNFMVVPSDVSEITSSDHDPVNSNNEMSGVDEMHSVSHTEGTTKCHQKSTPYNMSSTFVNPFDLTIDVTESYLDDDHLSEKDFPNIQHSFDVWHGAKNFGNKICRAASKDKQTAELKEWSKYIVNHLWHCYDICNTKEEFSFVLAGVPNHVVDKHEWLCPQDSAGKIVRCQHGPLDSNREKGWLKPNSPAHVALRKLVLDNRFLNQTSHYLTFRYTAELENFQNLILMYASKRIAYRPPTYRSRNLSAAIDHNRHINRPSIVNRDGTLRYQRSFNKKSRRWSAYPVKEDKTYDYIRVNGEGYRKEAK